MKLDVIVISILFSIIFTGCVAPGGEKSELVFEENIKKSSNNGDGSGDIPDGVTRAESLAAFEKSVYPIVTGKTCVACHGDSNINSPFFAKSNVENAFDNVLNAKKVNFSNPENSRLYKRLKDDKHNCWSNCDDDAEEMLTAIKEWAEVASRGVKVSGLVTQAKGFPLNDVRPAQTEYGTLIIQAEQEASGVLSGRYKILGDSKAIGGQYISGGRPSPNPRADAARTSVFRALDNCEPFTEADAMADGSVNGPYAITEQSLHISSGTEFDENGKAIKDGYSPYFMGLQYYMVRPDKRVEYAKMIRDNDYSNIGRVIFRADGFDLEDSKPAVAPTLTGNMMNTTAFNILPHFLEADQVIRDGEFLTGTFTDDQGTERNLHELFAPQFYDPEADKIYEMLDNDHRQKIIYPKIKKAIKGYFYKDNGDARTLPSLTYLKTFGFEMKDALDLKIAITLESCTEGSQFCSRNDNTRYEVNSEKNAPLTYDNALDWLKLNASGTDFVAANQNDQGAFRRIDLYFHPFVDPTSRTTRGDLRKTFSVGESGSYKDKESFSVDSNLTVDVDLDIPGTRRLDLNAYYDGGAVGVSDADSIKNFTNTLHPVLRSQTCVNCHGDNTDNNANLPKFAQRTAEAAWQVLKNRNLINFNAPNNSFRRAVNGNAATIVHNTNNAAQVASTIANAISNWKSANDADLIKNATKRYRKFTLAERTPGLASYRVKFTEAGDYNIWVRAKSDTGANVVALRVIDDNGRTVSIYNKKKSPTKRNDSCINYDIGASAQWKWFTPGRSGNNGELSVLDSLGNRKLKKGSEDEFREIPDVRVYWRIPTPGFYTIQFIERTDDFKLDLIAVDKVDDFDEDILDFQPDLRDFDEANISNYERNVLKYDVSSLAGTSEGTSFFEIEVKEKFDGQNYIFKNPRFVSSNQNLKISNIKALINNEFSFSDTTYTKLDYVVGNDRVLTFAPLVSLTYNGKYDDTFAFSFDVLKKTSEPLSFIDPSGSVSAAIEGRKCKNLELFVKTVKPILRQARLYRKDEYTEYVNDFPGDRRNDTGAPTGYHCISCHTQNHPYFKMTTFDNDQLLCEQALSRVDFNNYFQSLIIRGINGTYNHPKLHFIEELVFKKETSSSDLDSLELTPTNNDDFSEYRTFVAEQHALNEEFHLSRERIGDSDNYVSGGYVARWTKNHFDTYTKADVGITKNNYNDLTEREKDMARFIGELKRTSYLKIPNLENQDYYDPFVHDRLSGEILSENDDVDNGVFNDRTFNKYRFASAGWKVDNVASDFNWAQYFDPVNDRFTISLRLQKDGNNNLVRTNGNKTFNLPNGMSSMTDVEDEFERIKQKYRMTVIRWIRSEHERSKADAN